MSEYSIGIDVGGTFTDVTVVDMASGRTWLTKTPSTPSDPSIGFMAGLRKGLGLAGGSVESVERVIHGTTVATNAVLERKPTRVALITTAGFRGVLEIGRHDIPAGENYYGWVKPTRPVTPDMVFEVPERVDHRGKVVRPLDEAACRAIGRELRARKVESVAVCFLYAFLHPEHEQRVAEILSEECPGAYVSLSSVVLPQFREFERSMATVLNAYVTPHVSDYLETVGRRLDAAAMGRTRLFIMKSNGGVISAPMAARQAIHTALSGPAAGVIGAARIAAEADVPDIITIDVGGTSADVSLVRGDQPALTNEGKIGPFPLQLPIIDIHTIGAGGGSIAQINSVGRLTVGPRSAGAEPGPVCYGRGGTEPTVSDAHLVLGRIPPSLLGGEIDLDRAAAERAIREKIADPLNLSVEEAADGILAIANAAMVGAIRVVSIERGHDPRRFVLVAFGGAGPLHGLDLGRLLGIPRVLVPRNPGVLSTVGLLNADLRNDFVRTRVWEGPDYPADEVQAAFDELETEARGSVRDQVAARDGLILQRTADLRYKSQNFELRVDVPAGRLDRAAMEGLKRAFHASHERLYTYALPNAPVELVNLRVTATLPLPKARAADIAPQRGPISAAQRGERDIFFGKAFGSAGRGWVRTPVYERAELGAGATIIGPAVLEQIDSTTVLGPDERGSVDRHGNLFVDVADRGARV